MAGTAYDLMGEALAKHRGPRAPGPGLERKRAPRTGFDGFRSGAPTGRGDRACKAHGHTNHHGTRGGPQLHHAGQGLR